MEGVAADVEGGHFRVADFHAFGVGVFVEFAAHGEAGFVVVAAINSMIAVRLVSGSPRQFCVM
jgi:hypothetical protein